MFWVWKEYFGQVPTHCTGQGKKQYQQNKKTLFSFRLAFKRDNLRKIIILCGQKKRCNEFTVLVSLF